MIYQLFQSVQSEEEFNELLELTFTTKERALIIERWKIFDACDRRLSQRQISQEVPCSIVTATRGAKLFREKEAAIQRLLPAFRKAMKQSEKGE